MAATVPAPTGSQGESWGSKFDFSVGCASWPKKLKECVGTKVGGLPTHQAFMHSPGCPPKKSDFVGHKKNLIWKWNEDTSRTSKGLETGGGGGVGPEVG